MTPRALEIREASAAALGASAQKLHDDLAEDARATGLHADAHAAALAAEIVRAAKRLEDHLNFAKRRP